MEKTTILILVILGVMLIGGFSYASYKGFCRGAEGRADWLASRISKQLELDEPQQQRLGRLRNKALNVMQDVKKDRPQQIQQAVSLLDAPSFDREQARQIWVSKHERIAAGGTQLIDAFADFSDSLSQAQRDRLQAMIERHREHRTGHCCSWREPAHQPW